MGLRFAGIDEAGYGPMLGPLCVGCASFTLDDWSEADGAPDLWESLGAVVARQRKGAGDRIPIADSKELKLPSSSVRNHPLKHLERGVLAVLATVGEIPGTDLELFELLGVETEEHEWTGGGPIGLPLGNDLGMLKIEGARLRAEMERAGIALGSLKVKIMEPRRFNLVIREHRTKAATTAQLLVEHMREITDGREDEGATRIAIDRQGGRTHYAKLISRAIGGVETLEESARASRYRSLDGSVGVVLTSGAENCYLPVALASMGAKLVRELMMLRFNRYWGEKMPELKPTAGYVQDARRWLVDAEDLIAGVDREGLVRDA